MPHYDELGHPLVLSRNTHFISNQISDIEELIQKEDFKTALLTIEDTLRELHHSVNPKTNCGVLFRHQATALTALGRVDEASKATAKAVLMEAGAKRCE